MVVSKHLNQKEFNHEHDTYKFNRKQFDQHVRPYISIAKRGFECKIPLYKVFNYILYRLHTGCQWKQLPIEADKEHPEKKKSAMTPFTIIFVSGARTVAWKKCGKVA